MQQDALGIFPYPLANLPRKDDLFPLLGVSKEFPVLQLADWSADRRGTSLAPEYEPALPEI
ncbi:Uncharacterised protein [Streptococcus pneumoniae]|nr:Uncharacterised protein [Streptococcus pneumoniae]